MATKEVGAQEVRPLVNIIGHIGPDYNMRTQELLSHILNLIIYAVGGLFTLYWASIFFIGTEHSLYQLIAAQGLLALFFKAFSRLCGTRWTDCFSQYSA